MQADFYLAKAREFGLALDHDDFETAQNLLAENCEYDIGEKMLRGAAAIANSYEANMIEGRKKLDELVWGKCRVEWVGELKVLLFFTDYLKHRGKSHTFKCSQLLTFNSEGKIIRIDHRDIEGEPEQLRAFYLSVGLG